MIDYLEKLVEEEDYPTVLTVAENLMLRVDCNLRDVMVINNAIQTSRFHLGEYHGSIVPGQLALKLAQDLHEWDYYGAILIDLSAAYVFLRRFEEAISACYNFISQSQQYHHSQKHEWKAWYNLGISLGYQGSPEEGIEAIEKALEAAERYRSHRYLNGIRHALIGSHLAIDDLGPIPCLLAKCLHYIRHNPEHPNILSMRLWHFVVRCEYALKTGRFHRAKKVAERALKESHRYPVQAARFHRLLARVAMTETHSSVAMAHAIMSRVNAIKAKRYDLEAEASDLMYDLMVATPDLLTNLTGVSIPLLDLVSHLLPQPNSERG